MKKPILLLFLALSGFSLTAQETNKYKDLLENTQAFEGFFNFHYKAEKGTILLEIKSFNEEFLYMNALAAGIGSNDIGLDRGQIDRGRVVKFMRSGPKVLLVQPNYDYRAESENANERKAVEEAFAQSVLWGFTILAEQDGKVLIDITSFLLQDSHRISQRLQRNKQGSYKLDKSRSALYLPMIKNFPKNSEFEALLTFTGQAKGSYIRSVTPSSEAVSVRTHHSFIELPDDQYEKRVWDPRAGLFSVDYADYATPIDQPIQKRFAVRHRLIKKNPEADRSEAVEPIIYYVDRGAPEPIKSALIEGAKWWNQAFESAGFINAFQVQEMPEGADPLDIRYNVIQWVHRSTRGWSYGNAVTDPRTGEIIKGHVSLGSLRVRQDFLIAQGLISPFEEGKTADPRLIEMALARLRQLSAHEVGHTIGLAHNFSASTNNRASVMDYPHPLVKMNQDGSLNFEEAYAVGIGDWDKVSVQWAYSQFPESSQSGENTTRLLNNILDQAYQNGLQFLSDQDARAGGSASIDAHLWDNGVNPIQDLERILQIRKMAMDQFGMNSIPEGTSIFELERVLVPLYLSHRYQVEAVTKMIAGVDYEYSLKGDGRKLPQKIDPNLEQNAINTSLKTLSPQTLRIPDHILALMGAPGLYSGRGREHFPSKTPPIFDWSTAAETAANQTLGFMLHPHRLNRLQIHHAENNQHVSLFEYLDLIKNSISNFKTSDGVDLELKLLVEKLFILECFRTLENPQLNLQSQATLQFKIRQWQDLFKNQQSKKTSNSETIHYFYLQKQIEDFMDSAIEYSIPKKSKMPDGSPIGMGCMHINSDEHE